MEEVLSETPLPAKKRNNRLHAKGEIFFEDSKDFKKELSDYLSRMQLIIERQKTFLEKIYLSVVDTFESG